MKSKIALFVSLLLIAVGVNIPQPASANTPCDSGYLCTYTCFLSEACGYTYRIAASNTGCIRIDSNVYSAKNNTNYRFKVWKNSFCQNSPASYFYAHTSGDMNWEFQGRVIASVKRG